MREKILMGSIGAVVLLVLMSLSSITTGTNQTITRFEVPISTTFNEGSLSFENVMGYDTVLLDDCFFVADEGKPMLPTKEIKVALPAGMKAETVRVVQVTSINLPGEYTILPSQKPQHVGDVSADASLLTKDLETYQSSEPYPSILVELLHQTDLYGQGIAVIQVNPIQYVPSEKRLMLVTSVDCIIEGVEGYICGDYLPIGSLSDETTMYTERVKEMVVNPEEVELRVSNQPQTLGVGTGDYDYVIITPSSWVSSFQPLANWKTKKGIPANIVTTDWIYNSGGYSGTSVEKIRAFVIDANANWGTLFFLLGGDTGNVPTHSRTINGDAIANDAYYGDFDWDWTTEVHVGRASVTSTTQITTFVNKILTYEKNPPLTSYAKKAAMFGFDADYATICENAKIYIDNNYIPATWTMTNVYDSHTGVHKTNVINAVNAGQNLINHADHADETSMGVGAYNHGSYLSTTDVDNFNNGNKQSILYSIGCWANAIDYYSIAEHFVRDTNGGGVSFVGNSRYGWYQLGSTSSYSLLYDRYFFSSLFPQNQYKLGMAFSDHKNDGPVSDTTYQYIYTELTLLGDPELPIWKEDPTTIDSVAYTNPISTGSQSFTITVTDGGSPASGALVCVQKTGQVYAYGTTNVAGQITFTINPTTAGTMNVTATKQNLLPWEGTSTVSTGGPPNVVVDIWSSMTQVPRNSNFIFWVSVTNNEPTAQTMKLWTAAQKLPSGGMTEPVKGPVTITVAAGQTNTYANIPQYIGSGIPLGTYRYYARIGSNCPTPLWDEDYWDFEVIA